MAIYWAMYFPVAAQDLKPKYPQPHSIKNPYDQATASKHALIGWLQNEGLSARVRVGHGVVFPHIDRAPNAGLSSPPDISFAKPDLANIEDALLKCVSHWELNSNLTNEDVDRIVSSLAPTTTVLPKLSKISAASDEKLLTLTAEQVEAFSGLRSNRGGLVLGGAGTGKTILAIARAQQLAKDGFRTLLVCYNELLGAELAHRVSAPPLLTVCTFHTLCLQEAHRAQLNLPDKKPSSWWELTAPELLVEACARNDDAFDAIVVDEGQDFSSIWINSLRCLIAHTSDSPFYVFADPLQDIWKRNWQSESDFAFSWQFTKNMRNTHPIAEKVAASIGTQVSSAGIDGPLPIWMETQVDANEHNIIDAVVHLLYEGFGPSNIVVLCHSLELVRSLRERAIGNYCFGGWGGNGIPVETVSRFKGLESEAIVLSLSGNISSENIPSAYIGMSRARTVLTVIGTEQQMSLVNWVSTKS